MKKSERKSVFKGCAEYFLAAMLVALPLPGFCEQPGAALVLTSKAIGPLALGKNTLVSEAYLRQLFPRYKITHQIGSGDSPDFHYFEVIDIDGEVLFTIKSFIEGESKQIKRPARVRIDLLQVRSPRVKDMHGLRVGNRVQDIIKARGKGLHFGAGHHDLYLGADRIFYNIKTNRERSPEDFTLDDALRGNWQITSISWPGAAWE